MSRAVEMFQWIARKLKYKKLLGRNPPEIIPIPRNLHKIFLKSEVCISWSSFCIVMFSAEISIYLSILVFFCDLVWVVCSERWDEKMASVSLLCVTQIRKNVPYCKPSWPV